MTPRIPAGVISQPSAPQLSIFSLGGGEIFGQASERLGPCRLYLERELLLTILPFPRSSVLP